ncbi:hypothetical protein PoB_004024900 [Plakobranchus ocellatus]|uniref:Uncharacterized protein n=1 Tax=Plakobranchus ocellatus TaxID=259542 RepID=A0AAV4B155_9GAST|nr:hypothetical protein PoB_004024900 [Plakobranchus ocellatus]
MRVEISLQEKRVQKLLKDFSQRMFQNWGIGRQLKTDNGHLLAACQAFYLFSLLHPLRHMDRKAVRKTEDPGVLRQGWVWDLEGKRALGELGMEESPRIKDVVSSSSIARGAVQLIGFLFFRLFGLAFG